MRIKTRKVLRKIDKVKASIASRNTRFLGGLYWIASFSTFVGKRARGVPFLLLILPLAIQFAALQFAFMVLLGFFTLSLFAYRFANRFLRVFPA